MTPTDIVWAIAVVLHTVLALAAFTSMGKVQGSMTLVKLLLWAILIVLVPTIGSVLWFLFGRPRPAKGERRP